MKYLFLLFLMIFELLNFYLNKISLNNVLGENLFFLTMIFSIAFCLIDFFWIFLKRDGGNSLSVVGVLVLTMAMNSNLTWWALLSLGANNEISVGLSFLMFVLRVTMMGYQLSTDVLEIKM